MKQVTQQDSWPVSWKLSYAFDLDEIYGNTSNPGYSYAYSCRSRQALKLITARLSKGAQILDIGAAQGNFSLRLAELGYDVTWNDLRSELVDYVKLKYECGKIAFIPGDIFQLSFPSKFDAVLITEIIEHVAHPDEFLARAASLVKPGGILVMTTPNGAYFRNRLPRFEDCPDPTIFESMQFKPDSDGHIFLLHENEIETLARSTGLIVDEIDYFTNPLTNGHLKTAAILKVVPSEVVLAIEAVSSILPRVVKRRIMLQIATRFLKPQ